MYESKRGMLIIPLVGLIISLLYYLITPAEFQSDSFKNMIQGMISTCVIWIGCMSIVRILWEKFSWEHHPKKHLIFEVLFILIYLFLLFVLILVLMEGFNLASWKKVAGTDGMSILNTILITFLITAIHEAYYFYLQWQENFSKSVQLEKQNIQAQYSSLKAQVNPHFLFNSLNSLASLVDENSKAEKFVQDLSEFMRFALTSSERETVTLKEELENLDKYIWLMTIRLGENLTVSQTIKPEALNLSLPPLVLQILVENCIKHNIVTQEMPLHIQIQADIKQITVSNNLQKKTETTSTGLGLSNIIGRYRFFTDEKVRVIEAADTFSVSVPLIQTPMEE